MAEARPKIAYKRGKLPLFTREQISESPSRRIGVPVELENRLRQYMVQFMSDVSDLKNICSVLSLLIRVLSLYQIAKILKLNPTTFTTASILLQHFYMTFPISPKYDKVADRGCRTKLNIYHIATVSCNFCKFMFSWETGRAALHGSTRCRSCPLSSAQSQTCENLATIFGVPRGNSFHRDSSFAGDKV
jgi:hypothetical protein